MQKFFKVGQTVYHHSYGKGVVKIIQDGLDYPVFVDFEDGLTETFTFDGKSITGMGVSLSQKPIEPIVNLPLEEELKIGDYIKTSLGNVGQIVAQSSAFENSFIVTVRSEGIVGRLCLNEQKLTKITEEEYYETYFVKGDIILYKDLDEDDSCWRIGYFIEYEFKNGKNHFSVSNNKTDISSCISWNQCKLYKP